MHIQQLFKLGMDRDIPPLVERPLTGSVLNLGAGNKHIEGAIPLDLPEWDADQQPIPFPDNSIALIHAYHFLEHLEDPIRMLAECQRVLQLDGVLNIVVPYYNSQLFAQDLTHRRAFCEETWRNLFSTPYYSNSKRRPVPWRFEIGVNIIIGVAERNLCLMTQLIKRG